MKRLVATALVAVTLGLSLFTASPMSMGATVQRGLSAHTIVPGGHVAEEISTTRGVHKVPAND